MGNHVTSKWASRWFILFDNGDLCYFMDDTCEDMRDRVKLTKHFTITHRTASQNHPFQFSLQNNKGYELKINGSSHTDAKDWITKIQSLIDKCSQVRDGVVVNNDNSSDVDIDVDMENEINEQERSGFTSIEKPAEKSGSIFKEVSTRLL